MKPKADPYFTRRHQRWLLDDNTGLLSELIDLKHRLVLLAQRIDWHSLELRWPRCFSDARDPKSAPLLLSTGFLSLKHMEGLSDERLIEAWGCNPHYPYFFGEIHFHHRPPINPMTLEFWRKQLGEEGLKYRYSKVLDSALKIGSSSPKAYLHVCIDATVMEKNMAYLTDRNLSLKVLQKMVKLMQDRGLSIFRIYAREAQRMVQQMGSYAYAA